MRRQIRSRLELGDAIAGLLRGSWREQPPPLGEIPEDEVLELCLAAGCGPLAFWRARPLSEGGEVNDTVQRLHTSFRIAAVLATLREQQTLRVVSVLREAGIEPIVVKGTIAARFYASVALRLFGDVDVAVAPADFGRALEVMSRSSGLLDSCAPDLHSGVWDIGPMSWDATLALTEVTPLGDGSVRTLIPEIHLRLFALHFVRHDGYRPLWLCDVAAAVERRGSELDWDRVLEGRRRERRWILAVLQLARELLGASVESCPPEASLPPPRWFSRAILREWASPQRWPGGRPLVSRTLRTAPWELFRQVPTRWPSPVEASYRFHAPLRGLPRFPFQMLELARKIPEIATQFGRGGE